MPRKARQKFYDAIYHIMCRSISEVDLFKDDEDKKNYISLVKKYQLGVKLITNNKKYESMVREFIECYS